VEGHDFMTCHDLSRWNTSLTVNTTRDCCQELCLREQTKNQFTDEKGHSGGGGGVEAGGHGSSGHSRPVVASQQCV